MAKLKPKGSSGFQRVEVTDLVKPPSRAWFRKFVDVRKLSCTENPADAARALVALQALSQLTSSQARDVSELAKRALRQVIDCVGASRGAILGYKRGRSRVLAFHGEQGASATAALRVDRGTVEYVLETQTTVGYAHDVSGETYPLGYVPLTKPGSYQVMACLCVERAPGAEPFNATELEILTLLANQVAVALERVVSLTKLKAAQEKQHLRERMDRVLDAIPDGIAIVGDDGMLQGLNRSARKLFRDHTPKGASTVVNTFSVGDLVQQVFDDGRCRIRDVSLPTGETLAVSAYAIAWPTGKQSRGVALVFRDVTTQRASESHLLETERSRALGVGLAGIAHELNNPLTSIIGFVDLLASRVPDELQETCEHITEQAERCLALAREVLAFSRRPKREDAVLDVSESVERARHLLQRELEDGGVELRTEIADVPAFADPRQIQQIFVNLVQNAAQALVENDAPMRKITVRSRSRKADERVWIEVEDTGVGIPTEIQEQLFNPFFSTRPQGNGLGLSICAKIIKEYGGEMTVHSTPGRTLFRFDLPRAEEAAAEQAPSAEVPEHVSARMQRVLLIDDEQPILACVSEALAGQFLVDVECTGEAGLERVLDDPDYDVVVMDVRMPGIGGLDIVQQLQDRGLEIANRCILMTGEVDEQILAEVRSVGVAVLPKPFRMRELKSLITTLVPQNLAVA